MAATNDGLEDEADKVYLLTENAEGKPWTELQFLPPSSERSSVPGRMAACQIAESPGCGIKSEQMPCWVNVKDAPLSSLNQMPSLVAAKMCSGAPHFL